MRKLSRFFLTNRLERHDLVNEQSQDLGQVTTFVTDILTRYIAFAIVALRGFLTSATSGWLIPSGNEKENP